MDWFVAAEATGGDGSRDKPFHDPWLALHSAGPGDVIAIAAGTYFGRYDRSSWIIDSPHLTILGGYSRDFSKRTPWQTPSVFAAFHGYEATRENNLIAGGGDHSGLILDGLFFDSAGRNTYGDKPVEGLGHYPTMDGPIASFNGKNVTIKNCVFANSTAGGVELSGDGSRFENNLVINIIGLGLLDLRSASGGQSQLITVINNSFCFAHDTVGPPFGKGADNAIGVRVNCPAVIQNNLFVSCGNAAISFFRDADRIRIDGNLFYLTPHDILAGRAQGNTADILEKDIDELEDVGLQSASGNAIGNPGMTGLRPEWLDAYSRYLLANYATPPRDAANAVRAAAGLPAVSPADLEKPADQGDLAPRLSPTDALAISFTAKQGFHAVELPTQITARETAAVPAYRAVEWNVMDNPDPALANQRVELRAGLGFEQNTLLLADAPSDTHMGIRIYRPFSDDGSIYVLAKRFTLPNRQFEEAIKSPNGREVETTYFLRGIYRTDVEPSSRQKVTLVVESIVRAPWVPKTPAPRPLGRDWFVKAGASGGDGTREKPFRDPFQALDKAEGGDAIHVAGGDYFGKLRSGQWKILVRNLTLLGGYDAEFSERDPWKNPTRFVLNAEEKAKNTRQGAILASEENSDGLVLDGFIFDGSTYNTYTPNGALDPETSPTDTLVSLRGVSSPITVRHCLFMNTAAEAVRISCPFGVFENNVLLNTSGWALKLNANGTGPWVIRQNTFLFAGDPTPRAGTGQSSPDGTLLVLTGRAETHVESNIFAFADNYGVRSTIAQPVVSYDNNVFAANLFNHLTDAQYLWADTSNWQRRAVVDSAFASIQGNTLELPQLPVDSGFADKALARLFALPSRISADQWKMFAAQIGSSAKPPAPVAEPAAAVPAAAQAAKPAAGASLNDLLASLGSLTSKVEKTEPSKASDKVELIYCPVFDWKKALALFQEGADSPGAHKQKLTISFSAPTASADIQYIPITPQQLDSDLPTFDNKPVELEIAEARESSTNPSLFPAGTTKDDYAAFSASVGDGVRTHLSVIVRLDTTVSKVLYRSTSADRLRIRGTARVLRNPGALAVIVDSAEIAQSQ